MTAVTAVAAAVSLVHGGPAISAKAKAAAAPPAAPASAALKGVSRQLVTAAVVRGEFEQKKTLKGFNNALLSRGTFVVARNKGVVWQTNEPFASVLVLTRDRLLSLQSNGSVATRIDAQQQPGLRAVNQLLFALMSADVNALNRQFRIEAQPAPAGSWSLRLVPIDPMLAQWVGTVTLQGDRFVRLARFVEPQGDVSEIRFSDQTTANVLDVKEEARFE